MDHLHRRVFAGAWKVSFADQFRKPPRSAAPLDPVGKLTPQQRPPLGGASAQDDSVTCQTSPLSGMGKRKVANAPLLHVPQGSDADQPRSSSRVASAPT